MDWLILLIATLTAVTGNLILKRGMLEVGEISLSKATLIPTFFKVFFNPFIFGGLILYVISMLFWLKTLSLFEISRAYPILVAISFTLVTLGSYYFFKEELSPLKVLGMLIIFLGVLVVAKA